MADEVKGTSTGRVLLISVIVVLVLALAAWALGLFKGNDGKTTYAVDAQDQSGGELIVAPSESGVAVDLPTTPMTPAPSESATSTAAPTAE